MNYIDSKRKLSKFIRDAIKSVVRNNLSQKVFCDIFAGTGIIGRVFKMKLKKSSPMRSAITYITFYLQACWKVPIKLRIRHSVYGAFLKYLKRSAQRKLILEPAEYMK